MDADDDRKRAEWRKKGDDRAMAQHKLAGDAKKLSEDAQAGAPKAAERIAEKTEEAKAAMHGLDADTRSIVERGVTIVEKALALYTDSQKAAAAREAQVPPLPVGGLGDFVVGNESHKAHMRVNMAREIFVTSFAGGKGINFAQAVTRADEFITEAEATIATARAKDRKAYETAAAARVDLSEAAADASATS